MVTFEAYFKPYIPWPLNHLIYNAARGDVKKALHGQGTGRLKDEDICIKNRKEIDAVAEFLGTKKYFLGDKISSYDAAIYGFLSVFFNGNWEHELLNYARTKQNLREYVTRMRSQFFPEG
eukprot:CAMPEP_0184307936 /NCGR_PEP_ID=MMETSP1049-20130417/16537_1 /TAXON_ID=77928 /ORGANISM="Proteomonas sulcata, Strain CCMP704" /LENGTH=119 /DNA_ID=CAMNT_0026620527 /DNA_START=23 /DNA_END=382 /DNA_ORIENTATION=+